MTCIYRGLTEPRAVKGRHLEDCTDNACRGCQPCLEAHCNGCGISHVRGVCAGCMADLRDDLSEITRMCQALPAEALIKGVESEAFALSGPVADPEAFEHRTMSAAMGRIDAGWLECADDLAHPLWVLGTAELRAREVLSLPEPAGRVSVIAAAEWLDGRLSILAACEDHDWVELRRDLSACRRYMERVLHDGEQVEVTKIACIEIGCTGRLEIVRARTVEHDGWRCSRCGSPYDDARRLRALHQMLASDGAEKWVRVPDAMSVLDRPEQTLRTWITNGVVKSRRNPETGRVEVWWPDVRERHAEAQTRQRVPRITAV